MSSILVTGGAGFIGSHLVERLLHKGNEVSVIDNFNDFYDPEFKRRNIANLGRIGDWQLYEGDIRDEEFVSSCFKAGQFDEVIHLAAMAGVRPSIKNPELYGRVNLMGTLNILEGCRHFGVGRLLFASSSSVYGNNKKVPFAEDDFVDNPISPYAATKKSGELMVYTYSRLFDISAACLRFFTVYGPRQRPEMAIYKFTERILAGEEIEMYGDGRSSRDYTYVDDIIDGIMKCRESRFEYEVYNIGNSSPIRLAELIALIEEKIGKRARIKELPMQPGDVERTFADIEKARCAFGYEPRTAIAEGIGKFVDWYKMERASK